MNAHVELRLVGSLDHLRVAWQTGETVLQNVPFAGDAETTRYNVLLAVQEMVTNVLRHAYGGDSTQAIELSFSASDSCVQVEIRDEGPEFNPLQHAAPDLDAMDYGALEEGGYGIMIAKMVMDSVEYRREYQRSVAKNILRMNKSIDSVVPAESAQIGE